MFVTAIVVFALAALALLIGIVNKANANRSSYGGDSDTANAVGNGGIWGAIGLGLLGLVFLFFATFYQNGVGEAKVVVNSIDKDIVGGPLAR